MKTIVFNGMKTIFSRKFCSLSRMDQPSREALSKVLLGEAEYSSQIQSKICENIYDQENKIIYERKGRSWFKNFVDFIKINTKTFQIESGSKQYNDVQVSPDNRYLAYNTIDGCVVILEAVAIKHKTDHFIKNVEDCLKYSLNNVFDPKDSSRILKKLDDWNFFAENLEEILLKEQERESLISSKQKSQKELNIDEKETVKNFKITNINSLISQNMMAKNAALLKYKNREKSTAKSFTGKIPSKRGIFIVNLLKYIVLSKTKRKKILQIFCGKLYLTNQKKSKKNRKLKKIKKK